MKGKVKDHMCMNMSPLEQAVQFHGHICPGLLKGLRVAEFALSYLGVDPDRDEELVAIVEHDSCGVDAIQAVLGCTFGKGNLIFQDYGKQVYTIASRQKNRAVRVYEKFGVLKGPEFDRFRELARKDVLTAGEEAEKEDLRGVLFEVIMSMPFEELFTYREVDLELPPRAKISATVRCEVCGEGVMETRATSTERGLVCPDCLNRVGGGYNV